MKLSLIASGILLLGGCLDSKATPVLGTNGVYSVGNPSPQVSIAWNYSQGSGTFTFNVYQGDGPRHYTNVIVAAGATVAQNTNYSFTLTLPPSTRGTTNYIAVTAFNGTLESDFSNEINYVPNALPAPPPQKPPVTVVAQQKIGSGSWQDTQMAFSVDPNTAPMSEFRLAIAYSSPPSTGLASPMLRVMPATPPLPGGLK